ncbi:helix-turn-helix domain-containing protein [Nostoc linckia FACHB-104]|nr:helix-turn-helix domain-containing protein [Nostoc linckia FACHB-104]
MTVRINIKPLREQAALTQRYLADYLGTTETNYRRLEGNRLQSISYETLDKLCKLFKCTPTEIFDYVED